MSSIIPTPTNQLTDSLITKLKAAETNLKEIKRLQDKLKLKAEHMKAEVDLYKSNITNLMKEHRLKSILHEEYKVTLRKGQDKLIIDDESLIPEHYFVEETRRIIQNTLIKASLKAKQSVPGARLAPGAESLIITGKDE